MFPSPVSVAPGHHTSSHSLLLLFHHFNFLLPWGPLRLIGWWRHRLTSIPYIDLTSYWPRSSCQNLKNSADPSLWLKKDRSQSISEIAAIPAEWHRCCSSHGYPAARWRHHITGPGRTQSSSNTQDQSSDSSLCATRWREKCPWELNFHRYVYSKNNSDLIPFNDQLPNSCFTIHLEDFLARNHTFQ